MTLIVFQLFLSQCKTCLVDQRGYRDLNPVFMDEKVVMGVSGSEFFQKISSRMGLSFEEIWNEGALSLYMAQL